MNLTKKSPLTDVLLAYCAKRPLAASTVATYPNSLRVLTEVTDLRTVTDLEKRRPGQIQDAFDEAIETGKYSRKTLAMAFVLGKSLRRFLRLKDLVEANCFDAVRVNIGNNVPEENVLKPGELEQLSEVLAAGAKGDKKALERLGLSRTKATQLYAVVLMLGRHGLRVHELCKLREADVMQAAEGGFVATFRGKGNKLARMALSADAVKACETWRVYVKGRTRSITEAFCPSTSGQAMSRITLAHDLAALTERVLSHRVTPHGFRATFISSVISKRGIEAARKLARHSSLTTTQRYSRWEILDAEEES